MRKADDWQKRVIPGYDLFDRAFDIPGEQAAEIWILQKILPKESAVCDGVTPHECITFGTLLSSVMVEHDHIRDVLNDNVRKIGPKQVIRIAP